MKHYSEQMVKKQAVSHVTCDGCGKVAHEEDPAGWASFDSHHNDWGNDSVDSWDQLDACSWDCYVAVVRDAVEKYEQWGVPKVPTLKVDGKDLTFARVMVDAASPRKQAGE